MPPYRPVDRDTDAQDYEYDEDTPLHHIRPFGTGLHRRHVAFVKAGEEEKKPDKALPGPAVSDLYLRIVMGDQPEKIATATTTTTDVPVCDVCHLPLSSSSSASPSHASCLVHQVALTHSHPPSALDRRRLGLTVLAAYGWDPDSRRGLGAQQQGVTFPLQPKQRPQRQGLGLDSALEDKNETTSDAQRARLARRREQEKAAAAASAASTRTFGAKQIQKMDHAQRKRTEKLREQIMGNKDLDKYLYGNMEEG